MAALINAAYLEWRLSGGAANTTPGASLGGIMSSERIAAQTATGVTNITGITVLYAAGNTEGNGTLNYISADDTFRWTPPGGAIGPAVACTENCRLALFGAGDIGQLDIDVTFASLPVADQADTIAVANVMNEIFDDVSKADSFDGSIEYRCVYAYNAHPTDPFLDAVFFVGQQPAPGSVGFGKDPAGVGNGSTTGVATTVANEDTAPTGVTFSVGSSEGTGQSAGNIAAGNAQAVWTRRTVPPRNTTANAETVCMLHAQLYY